MALQKLNIFLLKGFAAMVPFLIANVLGYPIKMRMGNGERAVTFLPGKSTSDPFLFVLGLRPSNTWV
jgi:hypothetical protein